MTKQENSGIKSFLPNHCNQILDGQMQEFSRSMDHVEKSPHN